MLPSRKIIKRLWRYLKPYWYLQVATFLVMMVLAGLALAIPAAVKYMIDDLIPQLLATTEGGGINWHPAVWFGLALIVIYFSRVVFGLAQDYMATRIGASIISDVRSELFSHLETVSFWFYQKNQIGEITSRIMSDANRMQNLLAVTLLVFIQNVLLLIGIFVFLLYVNWKMTLVALIPVPLTILASHFFGVKVHELARRLQETIARLQGRLLEALSGLKTVRAFGQEKAEARKVDGVLNSLRDLYVKNSVVTSLAYNLVHFVNMLGPVVVLAWGTYLIASGSMKLGSLMAFYMLLTYLYEPVQDLASINVDVQASMASVNRVFEYLDMPPAITEDPQPVKLENVRGAIEFKNVNFRYNDSGFALEDISLSIQPGETVAIVGPSGSGKTTLVNLLLRFFDTDSGQITIDGVDVRRIELKSLRRCMALVDQDPVLFKMSIFDNIAYSDPDATVDDVEQAARIANIHEFVIGLKGGYGTEVGERGVTVSGGEKQRLCLARAVLRDPPIILLDEATSALDSKSEELIQQALKQLLTNKTAIVVAHRLATVRHADRIIVIDRGRIVDEGTHDALLSSSPLYRELASKQLLL
ncbi:MAG: ABC transporter ATP-binding protein [Candidatus Zixiibacteriota bacterium]|nr:MAG: ABC transporter ATP-binding protein [candidate division Zixibacteria bacterium]